MTREELYAHGYTLSCAAWGVYVYRTIDGSPEPSEAPVDIVATILFEKPLNVAEACARGWEAAMVHFVKQRLTT